MTALFILFAAILVYFSLRSLLGGVAYLKYFRRELAGELSTNTPFATIFAPCKGVEEGLRENLLALLQQDYPNFEIIFIVDDEFDPAATVIQEVLDDRSHVRAHPKVSIVIAPKATDSSQKVTSLRAAIPSATAQSEIFVFVDSDARPSPQSLRYLVDALQDDSVGAASGYRWFVSDEVSLASESRSVWNASIASALGSNESTNFCWGGSTVIRRRVFEELKINDAWRGTVSDDFILTRVVKNAGLKIKFVPAALTASVGGCGFAELLEFSTRQMKITRVYAPRLWVTSLIGAALYGVVVMWSFAIILFNSHDRLALAAAVTTLALIAALSTGKAYLRLKAVRLALPAYTEQIQRQTLPHLTLWAVTPFVYLGNCLAAAFSQRITWRGTDYIMVSDHETVIGRTDQNPRRK
ncbi:MAG: glycosyltransferase family 2 protein [Blastocatellia bacterium]|nr:glycosyltransferase family 2 protein [Blastocatellia bacterium]